MRLKLRTAGTKGAPRPRKRGLGSMVKGLTRALGLDTCGGCEKRAKKLDRASDKLRF